MQFSHYRIIYFHYICVYLYIYIYLFTYDIIYTLFWSMFLWYCIFGVHVCKSTMYMDGVCLYRIIHVQLAHHQTSTKSTLQVTFASPSTGYRPIKKATYRQTYRHADIQAYTIHTFRSVALCCVALH